MKTRRPCWHRLWKSLVVVAFAFAGAAADLTAQEGATPKKAREETPKRPGEVASDVCAILARGKTPWQLYPAYMDIFLGYAKKVEMEQGGTKELRQKQQQLVLHYRSMAALLQKMQACAQIRDGIKQNRTDVPFGERKATYEEQGKRHRELVAEFADMGSKLPGFKPPKESSRKR